MERDHDSAGAPPGGTRLGVYGVGGDHCPGPSGACAPDLDHLAGTGEVDPGRGHDRLDRARDSPPA